MLEKTVDLRENMKNKLRYDKINLLFFDFFYKKNSLLGWGRKPFYKKIKRKKDIYFEK